MIGTRRFRGCPPTYITCPLFQHGVGVGPPESEGIDAGQGRLGVFGPGSEFLLDPQGQFVEGDSPNHFDFR